MRHTEYITFKNVDMKVTYDYYPAEREVCYSDGNGGYPGSPDVFEIISVEINEQDATELMKPYFKEIEEQIRRGEA